MVFYNNLILQSLIQFFIVLVLVFGAIGFAVGIGLIVSSARTLRFSHAMNRWVSIRSALRPVEIPRDTELFTHKYRYWVGVFLIVGGIFSTFGWAARIDAFAVATMFAKGAMVSVVAIGAEILRWFLIVGSVSGVVIGFMLCYSPNALGTIEKYANKWYSSRHLTRGVDDMHLTLDKLIEAHPKPSGWILTCTALGVVVYTGALLMTRA